MAGGNAIRGSRVGAAGSSAPMMNCWPAGIVTVGMEAQTNDNELSTSVPCGEDGWTHALARSCCVDTSQIPTW